MLSVLPATAVSEGNIAFASQGGIYVMNADGTGFVAGLPTNSAKAGDPAWSPDGSKIAFTSNRDGNSEIYVMNRDGSSVTRLTINSANDGGPAWSPDVSKIAFTSTRDDVNGEIYVVNLDGTGLSRLTNNAASDREPDWSLDGTKIVFASDRDGNDEIYVMNADGTGVTRLTNNAVVDQLPAWSPDGSKIAFTSIRDGNSDIYVMNPDGSGVTRLTNNIAMDLYSAWSPDGSKIAFVSDRDGIYNTEIYVMNNDGTGQTRLTINTVNENNPTWGPAAKPGSLEVKSTPSHAKIYINGINSGKLTSWTFNDLIPGNYDVYVIVDGYSTPVPERIIIVSEKTVKVHFKLKIWSEKLSGGGKIAFTSNQDRNLEIYVMNPDGSGVTRITNNAADDRNPAWSMDGTKIAFDSNRDGNTEIYVMNSDGTGQTRLTNSGGVQPAWSPDGSKIAFKSGRDGYSEIYVMNADGTGQIRLTSHAELPPDTGGIYYHNSPTWSPTGSKIAFASRRGSLHEAIYVMNSDGTQQTRLSGTGRPCTDSDWSPTDSKIAFICVEAVQDIYIINADGTGLKSLTDNAANGLISNYPTWSPDSSKIAYSIGQTFYRPIIYVIPGIYVMNSDGTGQTPLIIQGSDLDWGPVGSLEVKSSPSGAKIYINGIYTEQVTRWKFDDMAPGDYKVYVTLDGYATPVTETVKVISGQTASLHFKLEKVKKVK
jgi:Tol biopolymer transport system component